jgi:protein-disulfide isomerase
MPVPALSLRAAALLLVLSGGTYGSVACARKDARSAAADSALPPAGTAGTAASVGTTDSVSTRADRSRIQGDNGAKVWMVVVSDFQCPYCRIWHDSTYPALVREYVKTGKLKIAYVNFPLPMHKNAWPAAEAVMCAGVQGRFWEMQDKVFATQGQWATMENAAPIFDSLATSVGADAKRVRACVDAHETRRLIQADYDRSVAAGVNSTPTFLIGDRTVEGAQPIEQFRQVLDSAVAKAK